MCGQYICNIFDGMRYAMTIHLEQLEFPCKKRKTFVRNHLKLIHLVYGFDRSLGDCRLVLLKDQKHQMVKHKLRATLGGQ